LLKVPGILRAAIRLINSNGTDGISKLKYTSSMDALGYKPDE